MNIDFDSYFRSKIESLLIKSSWVKAVQDLLALEAVSQVWGDRPEWYFWIKGAPGIYSLALVDAEISDIDGQKPILGQFFIKCYPYPGSREIGCFSAEEQSALNSDIFDSTHTPRIEAKSQIDDSWFTVGSISLLQWTNEQRVMLTYDSLEHIITCQLKFSKNGDETGLEVIRNVPGWEMGYPLFNCLIGLFDI